MDKATQASGVPAHTDSFSPEILAALEAGFRNMLIELAPSLYSPKLEKTAARKPTTKANGGKAAQGATIPVLRGSDIAFPSGNNVLDHSPNAPFKLDMHKLEHPDLPNVIRYDSDEYHNVADPDAFCKRIKLQAKPGGKWASISMMEFGQEGTTTTFAIVDVATRLFLRAHPLFNTPLHVEPHISALPFYVAEIPGRGKGLVASRRIEKGECIVREPPLFIMMQAVAAEFVAGFQNATDQYMHPRTRRALDALYNCHGPVAGGQRIGIVRTNGVAINFPTTDSPFGATFELISRVNHSCASNVRFDWSYKDFQGSIWAQETIQPGQELFANYASPGLTKKTRRAELLRKYKFTCTCTKCGPA